MNYKKFSIEEDVYKFVSSCIEIKNGELIKLINYGEFREVKLDHLIYNVYFSTPRISNVCQKIIKKVAQLSGLRTASLYTLYKKRAGGELKGFTVPAMNIRVMTYDLMRSIIRKAKELKVGLFIFEIARSEIDYTGQSLTQYSTCVLAAALRENYRLPLFIQGDHFQINRDKFFKNNEEEIEEIKGLIKESLQNGIYNIDVDCSTLLDEKEKDEPQQQRKNAFYTAEFTKFIRSIEGKVKVNIGGEIGEIGKRNSTPEDLHAFMSLYLEFLGKSDNEDGISKISVQTGTKHGGFILPDGSVKKISVDFNTLKALSKIAREKYKMAGAVQHGASTLPLNLFHKFPGVDTAEIHLATFFMNAVLKSKNLPQELRDELKEAVFEIRGDKRKDYDTDEQFISSNLKYTIKPYAEILWTLPDKVKGEMLLKIEESVEFIFKALKVDNTSGLLNSACVEMS